MSNSLSISQIEETLSKASIDAMIEALIDPKVRTETVAALDVRIAERQKELVRLQAARQALEAPIDKTVNQQSGTSKSILLDIIRTANKSLSLEDIRDLMTARNVFIKNLASLVWSLQKKGVLIKEGTRGAFRYRLSAI